MDQNLPPNFPSMVIDESLEQVRFEELRDLNRDQDQPMAQDIIAEEDENSEMAQEIRSEEMPHLSHVSDSSSSQQSRLQSHRRTDSGETSSREQALWEDLVAQGLFVEEDEYSERAQEQEIPSGEMPPPTRFVCSACDASYAKYSYLQSHIRIHEEFKESPDRNLDQDQPVVKRIRVEEGENSERAQEIRSGEWPYLSGVSSSSSSLRSRLQAHLRTYSGEEPHRCPLCGITFLWKDVLEKHMETHRG